jgi:hypothetical protein
MVSMFRTTRVVPVGIVAAKEDAIQAQLAIAIRMNLLLVMFGLGLLIHAGFEQGYQSSNLFAMLHTPGSQEGFARFTCQ